MIISAAIRDEILRLQSVGCPDRCIEVRSINYGDLVQTQECVQSRKLFKMIQSGDPIYRDVPLCLVCLVDGVFWCVDGAHRSLWFAAFNRLVPCRVYRKV